MLHFLWIEIFIYEPSFPLRIESESYTKGTTLIIIVAFEEPALLLLYQICVAQKFHAIKS